MQVSPDPDLYCHNVGLYGVERQSVRGACTWLESLCWKPSEEEGAAGPSAEDGSPLQAFCTAVLYEELPLLCLL